MTDRYINDKRSFTLVSIHEKYGELLTLDEVAKVLKYKSIGAVRKAHARGTLPVKLYRFPNKAGFYALAHEVAECIETVRESIPVQCCH